MSNSPRTRYIIVGMARSGTTATHRALYGHPNVCAMADELHVDPFFTKGVSCFTVGGENHWERSHGYLGLFDAVTLYEAEAPDPEGKRLIAYCGTPDLPKQTIHANGLKVAIPNAEDARLLVDGLQQYFGGLKIIHVRRRDWLAQCASLERAMQSGVWHSWTGTGGEGKAAANEKLTIPAQQFTAYMQMAEDTESQLARLGQSHEVCEFSYEDDLLANPGGCWAKLFEFLGVRAMEPTWMSSSKVAPPIDDFVENAAELRRLLDARRG